MAAEPTSLVYFASTPVVYTGGSGSKSGLARVEFGRVDQHVERALGDVEADPVAVAEERDRSAVDGLGRDVADAQAGGAAGEPAVGHQQHVLAEARRP